MKTLLGLEVLAQSRRWAKSIKGNIAYLCHSASVDQHFNHGITILKKIFRERLVALFGPQHGIVTDVQDNMIESPHQIHPYFKLPVYSLYGDVRRPSPAMLRGIDTIIVDLQDVGTRVYTYITTLDYIMAAALAKKINIVILDRPNPAGGTLIEGQILQEDYISFVGAHPIPQRHGMTIGEIGRFWQQNYYPQLNLTVIPLQNYTRSSFWPFKYWVNPSPNLATPDSAIIFPGTVLLEGTQISEGRGTTRPLEIFGHPKLEPFSFAERLTKIAHQAKITGFILRPCSFLPMFQKSAGETCHGCQIQVTNPAKFKSWSFGQILLRELATFPWFRWKDPPYEYEYGRLPIDLINGGPALRQWVENHGPLRQLTQLEAQGMEKFKKLRRQALLYSKT